MSTFSAFCMLNRPCEETLDWAKTQLSQVGLRVLQTFNLNTAHHMLADDPCPHHGMEPCDCQMVILLIYGMTDEPVTLILQGSDAKTWFLLESNSLHRVDPIVCASIQEALHSDCP
jgi:hypothetical protein